MQNIEEIYKENFDIVYKYIFCLTNNKYIAEEITQDTFAIAVKEIKKFRGECKISVWLCQIAKNQWYKELKRLKKNKIIPLDNIEETISDENIEELILEKDEKNELLKKIQKLDKTSKKVIFLRISGELSFKEIGKIMGKSENWARVTYYRGKQKLKEDKNEKRRL